MRDDHDRRARDLARRLLIVDTHVDAPHRLREEKLDLAVAAPGRDFDYPRARAGGLDVAFMAIYVPADQQETGAARAIADELIDIVEGLASGHPDRFALVRAVSDARSLRGDSLVGLALGMENGAPIRSLPDDLCHFRERGVRYVTLTHSKANHICDSSYDPTRPWGGLSPFGRELVPEMNRQGVMIDVSHVSDETFDQVLRLTRAPVIASHSSCRRFTPGWERNLSDEMIRALTAGGGVIQINFGSSFVDDRYRRARQAALDEIDAQLQAQGIQPGSEHADAFSREWFEAHPIPLAGVSDVADHVEHVARLVGVEHVGLGSDFDGLGDTLPEGLRDVSSYPNLIRALVERGFSESDLEKICAENFLRVWSAVDRVGHEMRASG